MGSLGVIAQVIKSLMILLLGGGLPALAVAHFGFCTGTSGASGYRAAFSLLLSLWGATQRKPHIFQPSPIPEVVSSHYYIFDR